MNVHIISMPWLVGVDDWLDSYGTTEKIRAQSYFNGGTVMAAFFAIYGV